jgi:hypothetical protein
MAEANNSEQGDTTFKPDPPEKVKFYQVLLLFTYHILLAVFLAYCIYNVWPPQPWPGDSPEARAEAKAEAKVEVAKTEQAKAAAQSSSQPNQNTPGQAARQRQMRTLAMLPILIPRPTRIPHQRLAQTRTRPRPQEM